MWRPWIFTINQEQYIKILIHSEIIICCSPFVDKTRPRRIFSYYISAVLGLKEHRLCVLLNEDNLPAQCLKLLVKCLLRVLTQLVPVWQQDGGAVENMRQGCLDELPAGDALDGLWQGRRQPVELILHQHPLKGLGRQPGRKRKETSARN